MLEPLVLEIKTILSGGYPGFVFGKGELDHVPVFSLHTVKPDSFEAQLRFLKENDYHTAVADEVYEHVVGKRNLPERTVMLSFDDGRQSVWAVACPLLKKYGFRACVFLTPQIIRRDDRIGHDWNDVVHGRAAEKEVLDCDRSDTRTLSWREVNIMHEEGIMDFQAHSLDHRRIPVSPKIVSFVNPDLIRKHLFEFGVPAGPGGECSLDPELGAPVYENAPALGPDPMYIEDPQLRATCVSLAALRGTELFKDLRWRSVLSEAVSAYRKSEPGRVRYETESEQRRRMGRYLLRCKEEIENRIPGKKAIHLAYPWGCGSKPAMTASREAGFVSNFWTTVFHKPANRPGDDPYRMVRLKHDFIFRLPGKGRKSLIAVMGLKFTRRAGGEIDY